MNSPYASQTFSEIVWPDFLAHFKSASSSAAYHVDVKEFMEICQKDFLQLDGKAAAAYYNHLQEKIAGGKLQPATVAKKIRELHSLAQYICKSRDRFGIPETFQDHFAPYLDLVAKQEKFVRSVPVGHIDRILEAAQDDLMAYCILVLLQRAGLSSTEIADLDWEDLASYENGIYAFIKKRQEYCYIPEDAFAVLEKYMAGKKAGGCLFCNSRGNRLNTMYISRLMKKYTRAAGVPSYSAEALRNSCAVTMFAYGAKPEQAASQMGITETQIRRYDKLSYRGGLMAAGNRLVKLRVELPDNFVAK